MSKRRKHTTEEAITYTVEDGEQTVPKRGCFDTLKDVLDKHDTDNHYYGLYRNESLIYTPVTEMVLKQYSTWFKFDECNPERLPCSPYETVDDFMSRYCHHNNFAVVHDGEIVSPRNCGTKAINCYDASQNRPLWIRMTLVIPINEDGSEQMYDIKANEPIGVFVRDKFDQSYFPFTSSFRVLREDATCKSEGFYESRGFSVKSRKVVIRTQTGERRVDLTGCKTIGDVAKKVRGKQVFHNNTALQKNALLDNVIMQFQGEGCFFISLSSEAAVFTMAQSVSTAANNENTNSILEKTITCDIYSHHLAVTLYDAWNNPVKNDDVNKIIYAFQRILSATDHEVYLSHKKMYTSYLSVELGRFLHPYSCLHQPSLKHKISSGVSESVPDFCCTQDFRSIPLVVADLKIDDKNYNQAKSQSFGYAQDVMTHSRSKQPIVAIPGTKERFSLHLCFSVVSCDGPKLVTIKIGEASVDNVDMMACFFTALKRAVMEIDANNYSGVFAVKPKPDLQLDVSLNSSNRVFLLNGKVYKFYDLRQHSPNIEVMQMINDSYFPMELHNLTQDKYIVYYTSTYIKQKDKNKLTLEDFRPIMSALDLLHAQGYVHSDVRAANILFSDVGEAKLIDFDLAHREGVPYPAGYNKLSERHPEAQPFSPRSPFHDRYSIAVIIEGQKFYSDFTVKQKNILETVKSDKCSTKLLDIYNNLVIAN